MKPPLWANLVGTVLGAGLSPVAPGTCGTLVGLPLAWALSHCGLGWQLLAVLIVSAVGTLAAETIVRATGEQDPGRIVVDELAGILVTFLGVAVTPVTLILGFALFRTFDIWKPFPVGWLDERVPGGLGVMLDDLAAGGMALGLLQVWIWLT